MRFAYIDSQGNEVGIPSVDALALRIELGAIGPDTELYDAQADRWGPARTHEIFNTLSRGSDDEGFVAPPPPVAPAPSADDEARATSGDAAPEPGDAAPEAAESEGEAEVGEPEVTLVEEEPAAPASEAASAVEESAADASAFDFDLTDEVAGGGLDDLELVDHGAPPEPEPEPELEPELEPEPEGDEEPVAEEPGAFDFGGMEALEVEEAEDESEPAPAEPGSGMQLEEPLGGGEEAAAVDDASGGLELERPMSEFSSDAPPSWMEQGPAEEEAEPGEDTLDFSPASDDEAEEESVAASTPSPARPAREAARERRTPRDRPSPPRRRPPRRSFAGPVLGILALVVLGGGGWYGWQMYQGSRGPDIPVLPPVTIPDIPAELLPTMRDLGEQALAGTVEEMEAMADSAQLPAEPRDDWLSGEYMANASDFSDVEDYWLAVEGFVGRIRSADTRLFHEEYEEALAAAEITGDTASMLLERADSGFLATREDRFEVYGQMEDLIAAALDLHTFLLDNESRIRYDPAAGGMSADPVMEAIPATEELGEEMWDRVDRITGALDRLGTLDRVTTERLLAVLFDRIRRAGFQ